MQMRRAYNEIRWDGSGTMEYAVYFIRYTVKLRLETSKEESLINCFVNFSILSSRFL